MAKFIKYCSSLVHLILLSFLVSNLSSVVADSDEIDETEPELPDLGEGAKEDTDAEGELETNVEVDEDGKRVLGGGPININIQRAALDEIDCDGREDGVQIQENPTDCQFFFLCIKGEGHKVECPKIPDQTYFNPIKRACANVGKDYCKEVEIPPELDEDKPEGNEKASVGDDKAPETDDDDEKAPETDDDDDKAPETGDDDKDGEEDNNEEDYSYDYEKEEL